jgi:hypothetical protein
MPAGISPGLVAVLVLSMLYFWVSLFAVYQIPKNRSESLFNDTWKRLARFQFYIFAHATARWISLVLSTAVRSAPQELPLREAILNDIPGLFYINIFSGLLFTIAKLCLRAQRKEKYIETLRYFLYSVSFGGIMVWAVVVILLSSATENGGENGENGDKSADKKYDLTLAVRDVDFAAMYFAVAGFAGVLAFQVGALPESMVNRTLGLQLENVQMSCAAVCLCFSSKGILLLSLSFSSLTSDLEKILSTKKGDFSGVEVMLPVVYYIIGEICCSFSSSYLLRCKCFVSEEEGYDPLLEKGCLPAEFEIDEHEIQGLTRIGQGGYAVVYKGRFKGQTVAVKKMLFAHPGNPDEQFGADVRRRFFKEGRFLCDLRHPRIVQLVGYVFFTEDQTVGLVTEFVSRGSLFFLLHGRDIGQPPPQQAKQRQQQARQQQEQGQRQEQGQLGIDALKQESGTSMTEGSGSSSSSSSKHVKRLKKGAKAESQFLQEHERASDLSGSDGESETGGGGGGGDGGGGGGGGGDGGGVRLGRAQGSVAAEGMGEAISMKHTLRIAADICAGMGYLQASGIIHRYSYTVHDTLCTHTLVSSIGT